MRLNVKMVASLVAAFLIGVCSVQAETGTVLSADSSKIVYETYGEGEPALVLIHCWSCDRSYWKNQIDEFSKDYLVVTIDLAGHGESDVTRTDWSVSAYGQDVVSVVRELGLDKVVLVGHSMGGAVALEAAGLLGDKVVGILGVDTFQDFVTKATEQQKSQMLTPMHDDFPSFTNMLVHMLFAPSADSALVAEIAEDMSAEPPEVGIGSMESLLNYDPAETLAKIHAPIIGINSSLRPVNVEANQSVANSFEVRIMKGVGHFPHLEKPAEFNTEMKAVLAEMLAAPEE